MIERKTYNFENYISDAIERRKISLINTMKYVGEECVNNARLLGTYQDQTGNLRSSIGYAVFVDGVIEFTSDFKVVKDGTQGAKKGRDLLSQISISYPKSVVLVVVAGMKYAIHVELKGYNVLTSAKLYAEITVPKMLKELGLL